MGNSFRVLLTLKYGCGRHLKKFYFFQTNYFVDNVTTKAQFLLQKYYSDLSQLFGPVLKKL